MHKFTGLLKREWQEHGSAFTWGPGVVLVIILLAALMAGLANSSSDVELSVEDHQKLEERLEEKEGEDIGAMEMLTAMTLDVAGSTDMELENKMATLQMGLAQPFHIVFMVLAAFALLASLYDERKDGSILFWKSMPVSDMATVVSKLTFVLWVAPLVTIAAILVAQSVTLGLVSLFVEDGMGGRVWAASGFWWQPLRLIAGYLLLGIWMLPMCAWLMLVSASVSRLPALWAVGVPWVLVLLEKILFGSNVLGRIIGEHLRAFVFLRNAGQGPIDSVSLLLSAQFAGGLVIAAIFLAGAVYFRRRNNQI